MSGQVPQTAPKSIRPNVSPSQRGPLKAVKAFSLNATTRRSPSSPTPWDVKTWQKRSPVPESRHSPDRRSPGSPNFKVERPKAIRLSPATSSLRRTGSLDTIGPYLKGQWPADIGGYHHNQPSGPFMSDKGTQTPEEWPTDLIITKSGSKKKKKHRRSASFGHGDKLALNSIRQKLQKTKDQGTKQRQSPIPASHQALSMTAPAVLIHSAAIGIPNKSSHIPKASMSRYQRNSVEGLNPEIEKLVQMTISDDDFDRPIDIPEGHRAPVPCGSTRSVDTQTPSGILDESGPPQSPASPASRPQSISPFIAGHMDNSPRPSSSCNDSSSSTPRDSESKSDKEIGDRDSTSPNGCNKTNASPKPNKIVREPPDGCEKVKVIDENRTGRPPSIKEPLLFCPIQGQGQFVLTPSISSAFCPLTKLYTQGTSLSTQTSPRQATIIEGQ